MQRKLFTFIQHFLRNLKNSETKLAVLELYQCSPNDFDVNIEFNLLWLLHGIWEASVADSQLVSAGWGRALVQATL